MKKYLLVAGLILAPWSAMAATVTAYIAANCNNTNSAVQQICNNPVDGCSSTGQDIATGTYASYDYCTVVKNPTGSSTPLDYIACFPYTSDGGLACQYIKNYATNTSNFANYYGAKPSGTSFMGSALGKTVTVYLEQLECWNGNTDCRGYSDTVVSGTPSVTHRLPKSCTTSGTCGTTTTNQRLSCSQRYYSAASKNYVLGGPSSSDFSEKVSELNCKSCASLDSTANLDVTDVMSPVATVNPRNCYIPKDHDINDSKGTYKYTNNCGYTP